MNRCLTIVLLAGLLITPGQARLGESIVKLKERFGQPASQGRKDSNAAVWFFEVEDGQLVYTVTFNAKGQSIAEGLKPLKHAQFKRETVQDFIDSQMEPYRGSKTTRTVKPGENYSFAGKLLICAAQESIIVDDPNGILIVWTRGGLPSVIVVGPEMMK